MPRPEALADAGAPPGAEIATWSDWREYLDLVKWLVPDVFRHARLRMLGVLALSGVGVGARAAAAGVLLLFVHAQQNDRRIEIRGFELPADPTLQNLLLWGGASLLLSVVSVAASYRCDRLIFAVAQRYVEYWSRAVVRFVASGGAVRVPSEETKRGPRPVARLLAGSSFRLVRVVINTLSIVLPAITGLVAAGVLFFTQPVLTALLIPIGLCYAVLLGSLNRGLMRDAQLRMESSRHFKRDVTRMLRTLESHRFPRGLEPRWLARYPKRSWMADALKAWRGIIFAKKRVNYMGDLFQGIALLVILMAFGTVIVTQGTPWAVLLTYMVALGYAVRSLSRVSKSVTQANRFLPDLRHYLSFIRAHPDLSRAGGRLVHGFAESPPVLEVGDPPLPASEARLTLRAGTPVLCLYPEPLQNSSLEEFCLALANGDPRLAVMLESELFTAHGLSALPERTLWEYLPELGRRKKTWGRAREILQSLGVLEEFESEVGSPDAVLSVDADSQLSAGLRLALRLLPGLLSTRRLAVVDGETLELLDADLRRSLFATLGDRVLLIAWSRAPEHVPEGVEQFAVVGDACIQGVGDVHWFEAVARPAVAGWLVGSTHRDETGDDEIADLDDLDDDMD